MVDQRSEREPEFILGFLALFDTEAGDGRYGAAMVTDERGVPLEFRVSPPVRPTALHRAIYGETLWPYVEGELITVRLLSELRLSPALVLTNRVSALDAATDTLLCFVSDADMPLSANADGLPRRRLNAVGATHTAQIIVATTEVALRLGAEQVTEAMGHFDLVEAFKRIETAYGQLATADERYD